MKFLELVERKLTALAIVIILLFSVWRIRADSVVVFNEIMYHPITNESELEWIELYNQLAVDVDISNWSITNGIFYKFPEGTIVPGGGYIVVAKSPSALMALTGLTNVYGPFSGRLDNNGETIELRNNNNRLMDIVKYGVEGEWDSAPDGTGPSLAKRDQDSGSEDPASWTKSEQVGGTPGRPNFLERIITISTTNVIKYNSQWRYFSGAVSDNWKAIDFNDSNWQVGSGLFSKNAQPPKELAPIRSLFNTGLDTNGLALAPGFLDGNYVLTYSAYSTPPPPPIPATVVANHPNWIPNDATSRWIGPVAQGTANVPVGNYNFRTYFDLTDFDPATAQITFQVAVDNDLTNVSLNGNLLGISYSGFTAYSQQFTITNGFKSGTNEIEFFTYNSGTLPTPAGLRLKISGSAMKSLPVNTTLNQTTTHYFRNVFVFDGEPKNTRIILRAVVDDGAVIYLNGTEISRLNMPSGVITPSTYAFSNVVNPAFTDWIEVDPGALVSGTNVFAVEVHQAVNGTNDILFGAEVNLIITNFPPEPPPTIAFNEISSVTNGEFWIELINYGNEPISLENFVLGRFGTYYREYIIPSNISLEPGGFIVFDRAGIGFGADPGDNVALYTPDKKGVVDSIIAKRYPQARYPDGVGCWMNPTELTPGFSNRFVFQNDIVINEIMYHPPDLPAQPALYFTNKLVNTTNTWRYYQVGNKPDGNWFLPEYDDSNWQIGRGVFYANISSLPAPRGTILSISNGSLPIITYYFRTSFVLTNVAVEGASLLLNLIIDDGAVIYLNGMEIYRYGMPEGELDASTLAITNIGVPGITGPITLPASALVNGTNYLAVEVHQYLPPPGSRDVAFALELTAFGFLSPPLPERPSPEYWIELYNRGSNIVDLTGWKIDGVTEFEFPAGQKIPPDGYLVVAYDVDFMRGKYPGISIIGPLKKKLSKSGGLIVLKDANGNPADKVQYYDRFPFSEYADGCGSTLELRNPRMDNFCPEAWAPSDENGKSSWVRVTYRGVATKEPANSPTYWNEFVMGIIDAGEIWLDDISVIESPGGTRRQLIQNGTFETGLSAWRIIGSHRHSEVIPEPGNPSNHILRLIATAPTEHIHNHAETTLAYGASITNGIEYEISYRAKWIAGCNKLNTRLYFNRLPKTQEIPRSDRYGTPGARNSTYVQNTGPTFSNLKHFPLVPYNTNFVTVSVELSDPDGVSSAVLKYSVNGGVFQTLPMSISNSMNRYGSTLVANGVIPQQSSGSVVQFYIEAKDSLGAISTYPAGGANSRAMYKVDDGQALMSGLHNIRIIMTPSDAALLHSATNMMSNELLGCTVIVDGKHYFYNSGVHLQGSERNRVGFTVRLPAGQKLWGVHDGFSIDRSGGQSGLGGRHDEILLWRIINKAGGLQDLYDDLCQLFSPRGSEDGTGFLRLSKYGNVYLDSTFKNGSDGEMYKLELIYYPTNTVVPGDPQSLKVPNPDLVLGTDIQDLGDDKENYRWTFLKENRVAKDNYEPMIALAKAFSLTGTNLEQRIRQVMDVDEWTRAVAFLSLIGSDDMYTYNNSHNLIIYFRPEDGRGMAFLWDLDYSFVASITKAFPGSGSPNTYKIITTIPDHYRRYYHHLYDLTSITGDSAFLTDWANRYARLLGQNWSGVVNYLVQRANFVRSYLPVSTPFSVNTNGANLVVANNRVTLTGTAPISVENIEVNGIIQPVYWTSMTNWTLTVPVPAYTNLLQIRALGSDGNPINGGTASVIITNQNVPPLLPIVINEWMADNSPPAGFPDPADGNYQDWFELYNPNNIAVNLSGYFLTDSLLVPNKFVIPSNTVIQARGFLLVWADGDVAQNDGINSDLHVDFKLNKSGDLIALFSPDGSLMHSVAFGGQYQNVSQGLYPDGNTNQFYFMTNWTPRLPNKLGIPSLPVLDFPVVDSNGKLKIRVVCEPYRLYILEYNETLGLSNWIPIQTNRSDNGIIFFNDIERVSPFRFYRARLLQ